MKVFYVLVAIVIILMHLLAGALIIAGMIWDFRDGELQRVQDEIRWNAAMARIGWTVSWAIFAAFVVIVLAVIDDRLRKVLRARAMVPPAPVQQ